MSLVKRCPACGTEHPPTVPRCSCGMLLAGVDLSEPADGIAAGELASGAPAPLQVDEERERAADEAGATRLCPHADCGQRNTAGRTRCVYCDRELDAAQHAWIAWPWGECDALGTELMVGRVPPASAALIARLERDYSNVSRRHAVLRSQEGSWWVEDLGSANGTFVNEVRVPAGRPIRLHRGARIRFGADLLAVLEAGS